VFRDERAGDPYALEQAIVKLRIDDLLCVDLHIYPTPLYVVIGAQLSQCREQTFSKPSMKLYIGRYIGTSENVGVL
jgi:hypothetical protein